jgi:hypothetical protein
MTVEPNVPMELNVVGTTLRGRLPWSSMIRRSRGYSIRLEAVREMRPVTASSTALPDTARGRHLLPPPAR